MSAAKTKIFLIMAPTVPLSGKFEKLLTRITTHVLLYFKTVIFFSDWLVDRQS